jgi:hypothetical protein
MKKLLVLVAACGGGSAAPDAAPDASTRCTAVFTGNFTETSVSDGCATAGIAENGDVQLTLSVPSQTLNSPMVGTFDLGAAPTPGAYSSRTVSFWRMRAAQRIGEGSCLYAAGTLQVPEGSFDLQLTSLDTETMHGTLDLTQFILGFPSTDCGDTDTEQLHLDF